MVNTVLINPHTFYCIMGRYGPRRITLPELAVARIMFPDAGIKFPGNDIRKHMRTKR